MNFSQQNDECYDSGTEKVPSEYKEGHLSWTADHRR